MFAPGDMVECVSFGSDPNWARYFAIGGVYEVERFHFGGERIVAFVGFVITPEDCVFISGAPNEGVIRDGEAWVGWNPAHFRLLKRRDPDLMLRLLHEPAPIDLVAA